MQEKSNNKGEPLFRHRSDVMKDSTPLVSFASPLARRNKLVEQEEKTLAFWREHNIFEKTLEKNKGLGKEFVFYEGPPTANGKPGIHHLEARVFKDAIPRYKTMQGFYVRRKSGWDTHGLPVELAVEKELGLKSKKEIESYGIAAFNERCKESVWKYVREWEEFTQRSGYWVDLKNPYITYKREYTESVWNIIKTVHDKGLLYKDYKVLPWCPRCGTALSSHELAQGYEDVKDLSVTVKLKLVESGKLKVESERSVYLLAWTTTPWTLPGNVALAVGGDIEYSLCEVLVIDSVFERIKEGEEPRTGSSKTEYYLFASLKKENLFPNGERVEGSRTISLSGSEKKIKGKDLVGLEYEPLFPFIRDNISDAGKEKLSNAYKVYAADFVTTEEGTGIVHTAVMYGQDDFELGTKVGLPKYHLVNEDGTFKKEAGFLAGKFVKEEATDVEIIKDLSHRGLLFAKEKYQHSYPFCWRCHTPLIYFARDSWYIRMSALREKLVKENKKINWEPSHIKEGRFGEWLREVKDWAISRERYWGTPLPVWICRKCGKQKVAGSITDIEKKPRNNYFVVRHGQSENNVDSRLNSDVSKNFHLTKLGREQAERTGEKLSSEKVDLIFSSPFTRTRETAEFIADKLGVPKEEIVFDERLRELGFGSYEGRTVDDYFQFFKGRKREEIFSYAPEGAENRQQAKNRTGKFLKEVDAKYEGKNILIVSHEGVIWMMESAAGGLDMAQTLAIKKRGEEFIDNAEIDRFSFRQIPRNNNFGLDLHRPYIDEVKFTCSCGGEMSRVKEVMDVWFDSGAMPFAQDHYPFEAKERIDRKFFQKAKGYPADFISEAIDQTRGWFYTLHAIGALMGKGAAYKNVVCLGHILDAEGKKMSKSIGNVVDPFVAMEKFGADPLRFWMYSVNQPGESKNFDERTVDEVVKKVFNLAGNVLAFYELYADKRDTRHEKGDKNVLDRWIIARLNQLTKEVTDGLENYKFLEPTRAIRDFIADLSQWYIRRSRDRFKEEGDDKQAALATTLLVLLELSKLMAPFTPFFAEHLYKSVGGGEESVHLEDWPSRERRLETRDKNILGQMEEVRKIVSLALEARAKANIKVRQPLSQLKVKSEKLEVEFLELLKDEVNVKEVKVDGGITSEVALDTTITSELKEEGDVREFIRAVQELRKKKGLTPGDVVTLKIKTDDAGKALIENNKNEIQKTAKLSLINYADNSGQTISIDAHSYAIDIVP